MTVMLTKYIANGHDLLEFLQDVATDDVVDLRVVNLLYPKGGHGMADMANVNYVSLVETKLTDGSVVYDIMFVEQYEKVPAS